MDDAPPITPVHHPSLTYHKDANMNKRESYKLFDQHLRNLKQAKKLNQVKHVVLPKPPKRRRLTYDEVVLISEEAPF